MRVGGMGGDVRVGHESRGSGMICQSGPREMGEWDDMSEWAMRVGGVG